MSNTTALIASGTSYPLAEVDKEVDLFGGLLDEVESTDPFEVKKDYLAVQMAALMSFAGKTRSEMGELLGWKRSRVTSVLSGRCNPTAKTIHEFSSRLGYDFEVIFKLAHEASARQPWAKAATSVLIEFNPPKDSFSRMLHLQTAPEVAADIAVGAEKSHYISLIGTEVRDPKSLVRGTPKVLSDRGFWFENFPLSNSNTVYENAK